MPEQKPEALLAFEQKRAQILAGRDASKLCVTVCAGTGCLASGGLEVKQALGGAIQARGLAAGVRIDDANALHAHSALEIAPVRFSGPSAVT